VWAMVEQAEEFLHKAGFKPLRGALSPRRRGPPLKSRPKPFQRFADPQFRRELIGLFQVAGLQIRFPRSGRLPQPAA